MHRRAALGLAVLLVPAARAQIAADRPGIAFGSEIVGVGVVQVEAGLPEATLGSDGDAYQVPLQVRVGVAPGLEVRVLTPVLRAFDAGGLDLVRGFDPVVAGVKVEIPTHDAALALITEAIVPTNGGGVGLQINAPATVTSGDVEMTFSPGVVVQGGTTTLNIVGALERAFGRTLEAYAEAGAFPVVDGGSGTPMVVGGGVLVRPNPDVQLDAFFDAGVSGGAPDLLVGIGLSFRIR